MNNPNLYFLGLYDTSNIIFDGLKISHPRTSKSNSGIYEYFPLFEKNFVRRGNWYSISPSEFQTITFSISNSSKFQKKSLIHFRILLDGDSHVISDKAAFYEFFSGEEFITKFQRISFNPQPILSGKEEFSDSDIVVLKPNKGCLGMGIKIGSFKEIISAPNSLYKDWTISNFHIPRLFNNKVVTNRLYFLITKRNETVESYLYDEFVNYQAMEPLENNSSDYQRFNQRFITNYTPSGYSEEEFYLNRYVSHQKYVSIFTKKEFETVFEKIKSYLSIITRKVAPLLLSPESTSPFHIYGVDTIITDDLDVKILEINGAPSIADRKNIYPLTECTNYYILINALMKVIVDPFYPPLREVEYQSDNFGFYSDSKFSEKLFTNTFIPIEKVTIESKPKKFYIVRSVNEKYPFIAKGFFSSLRSYFYQRTKNPYDEIDVFYGLRDLYSNPFTSKDYYNEVVDFNRSECSRNSKVVNKIQGVTYFLANKERLYQRLIQMFGEVDYHPPSIVFSLDDERLCSPQMIKGMEDLSNFIKDFPIIVKPSDGSQGKGIVVIESPTQVNILSAMMKTKKEWGYSNFIISKYISNPYLYRLEGDDIGRKINIRFYVLLFLEKELKFYLLKKKVIYFSILPYRKSSPVYSPTVYSPPDEDKLRSLTNLQLVNYSNSKYGTSLKIKDFVLDFDNSEIKGKGIEEQFVKICRETIAATRKEFRSINRFIGGRTFNLIAYDTLLDEDFNLHLIEVNRGADLVGLHSVLGEDKTVEIFRELFDICVDSREDLNLFEKL